jgi:26S proteasome regulatory subunit N10
MKMQANQETSVGVMAMAGSRAELLLSPTTDLGHVLAAIQNLRVKGTIALSTALRTSQLALSHRLNKHQKQRIIAFTGSPITENAKDLVKLGKLLRKNNMAVDVISFGEENTENENMEKLDQFIKTVNSNDNRQVCLVSVSYALVEWFLFPLDHIRLLI